MMTCFAVFLFFFQSMSYIPSIQCYWRESWLVEDFFKSLILRRKFQRRRPSRIPSRRNILRSCKLWQLLDLSVDRKTCIYIFFRNSLFFLYFPPSFSSKGVGTVISGTCLQGIIRLNDNLLLGPDPLGHFAPVLIKGIHRKRMPVREVRAGQTCSFALKKVCVLPRFSS